MRRRAKSKYGAIPTMVDGIKFASKKEAHRYRELKLLETAGEIHGLLLQQKYVLEVDADHLRIDARRHAIGFYRADFSYYERDGREVVEDVKGFKTPLYKWKKRHVEAQYGIEIREI